MYDSFIVDEEGRSHGGQVIGVVSFHPLFMVNARRVVTGVSVGVFVLEGFGWFCLFGSLATGFLFGRWVFGVVQVPGRWR